MSTELPFYTRYADGFRIDVWTVLPRSNELSRPGETVHVEPKPMQVLTLLAERAGETLTRDELLEAVWPGVYVSENALSRCISQLRKVFGDDARRARVIETIPTIGYRLIAPVHALGDGANVPSAAPEVALSVPDVAVAQTHRSAAPQADTLSPSGRTRLGWVSLAVTLAALGLVAWLGRGTPTATPTTRPLTSEPGREMSPELSPDGSRVLYTHVTDSDAGDVYVRVVGSGTPLQLTNGPGGDRMPIWAPDGRSVAFIRCEEQTCRLFSVPALGGEARGLDDAVVNPWGLSYTPDGRYLLFAATVSGNASVGIQALGLDTRARRILTTPPATHNDVGPVVAPDGRSLVFCRRSEAGGEDLYTVPLEGGEPQRLTDDNRSVAGYSWMPDGRSIVFSSNRTGMYELWKISATGGTPERVRDIVARDPGRPSIGERQLVFEEWAFEVNLWTAYTDSAEARSLVVSTWWDKHPHLSPDGARIAFISNRSGWPEVWVAASDGSNPTRLTEFDGASVEAPRWSPDGLRLVFQARPDVQADLYVMDAEGGAPRALTPETSDEVLPRWSRDGQRLYFGSNRDGTWQLWSMAVEGGEATRVTDQGGIVGEEAWDGSEVLYAKATEPGLWARSMRKGERLVTEALVPGARASWAVTETGVLLAGVTEGAPRVLRIDPATGSIDALPVIRGQTMPGEPGLTASADGQHIIYAQVDRVESDLMLVAPFE